MAKNAYELRFDTLTLARDHLIMQYQASVELASMIASIQQNASPLADLKYPTMEDILALATKLKVFVDD